MKLVWWQAAIISSIIFVVGIFPLTKLLNSILPTRGLFDFGYYDVAILPSFLGANIVTFFITKRKKLYAFIALWFSANILVVELIYLNVPFPAYHYLFPVAFLNLLSGRLGNW
jgi:hypothetical protein